MARTDGTDGALDALALIEAVSGGDADGREFLLDHADLRTVSHRLARLAAGLLADLDDSPGLAVQRLRETVIMGHADG
jgi:hypothetical protein